MEGDTGIESCQDYFFNFKITIITIMKFRIIKKRFYRVEGNFEAYYIQVEKKRFLRKPKFVYPNIDGINDGQIRTIEQLKNALMYLIVDSETIEDRIIDDINDL